MKRVCAMLLACSFAPALRAADAPSGWSQFRGPAGTGIADGQKPPTTVGPDKNVKWKVAVPPGTSSPVVAGDKLVLTAFEGGKLLTIAYDRATGKEAWRREAPAKAIEPYHKTEGSPASSTPATDGEHIVSYFGSCGLFCYDLNGRELWKHELPTAQTHNDFGTGTSPVIADGKVVLVRDLFKGSQMLALDAKSGSVVWDKPRQAPTSYTTPVIWKTEKETSIVVAGFGRLVGYDLATGGEKWFVSGMPAACCSSPVVADGMLLYAGWSPGDEDFKVPGFDVLLKDGDANKDGVIDAEESKKTFLNGFFENNDTNKDGKLTREEWDAALKFMSNSKNSAFAVKPGGSGDITKSHVLWKKTKGLPYVPTAIAYGGQYVMVKDGGLVSAYDQKTGKEIYTLERAVANGRYYASPVAANGNIYFTSLENGAITVLKAGAEKPTTVAANLPLGERTAATPAIADNRLYVRTATKLYAFGE